MTDNTNLDHLSREVAATVFEFGPPFFEQFTSKEAMLTRLGDGKGLPRLTKPQALLVHAMLATEMALPKNSVAAGDSVQ